MYLTILNFLKSTVGQYIIIGVLILGLISYHKVTVWSFESDISKLNVTLERTELDLDTTKGNLKKCITTNKENNIVLVEFENDIKILKQIFEMQTGITGNVQLNLFSNSLEVNKIKFKILSC